MGMGDHTMQNGKRCTAASIVALLGSPEPREAAEWSAVSSSSLSSMASEVSSRGEAAATLEDKVVVVSMLTLQAVSLF
ncbi:hypothetical protein PF001_g28250 [Phytophthora fragariae]|uniref:Uncharacterized protein n=1 Tax=Phytophthora fragariae TaxID=53985 RepID=A0A6A4BD12_9STRA|nr:hypothetical protein PF004_g27703 [Phytophthora fragariae]KAE9271735.1 hypothetical protein PF001_g28250 [Phytophthora fragariae]